LSGEEVELIAGAVKRVNSASNAWTSTEEAVGALDVRLKREVGSVRLDAMQGFKSDVKAREAVLCLSRAYVEPGRPDVEHALSRRVRSERSPHRPKSELKIQVAESSEDITTVLINVNNYSSL
jgi:hypothetical protein